MSLASILQTILGDKPPFTFCAAGGVEFRVIGFRGHENLSSLFEFRLELAGPEVSLAAIVDQRGVLRVEGLDSPRYVNGIVAEIEYVGQSRRYSLYEATLVPWIWRLQHRQACRIFQDKTTPQILEDVLTGAGLSKGQLRMNLLATYVPRDYCVQYCETDLAFLCRLMEEDGIFYYFEHSPDQHVLVLGDYPHAHGPIPGEPLLWFIPPGGDVIDREHIQRFRFGERVRPGKSTLRDFNINRPELEMDASADAKLRSDLEIYTYPGEYQDPGNAGPGEGSTIAKNRLEALQTERRWGTGASDCSRLTAGHVFTLVGHPRLEFDAVYRLLRVEHVGSQPQVLDEDAAGGFSYRNDFSVTELSQPFRPLQQTPRPLMRGLQSATVVGPEGEEVYPDEHARVKVQFHWDRAEPFDETSSCWVRVSQLWAGNGWGTLFIPRIGHEVLVDFLEGDPDRPVVVGRIYTGMNKPPYSLPEHRTRTTIKTESSIGGGGYNEFRFEDLKGREEIYLHAQCDWNTVILNNLSESVGAHRKSSIGSNEVVNVGEHRMITVGVNDTTTVGAIHTVVIAQPAEPPPTVAPTRITMHDKYIQATTAEATITIQGPDVLIQANGNITLAAGNAVTITAGTGISVNAGAGVQVVANDGDLTLQGGPMVKINC